jgi:hypothetical protein
MLRRLCICAAAAAALAAAPAAAGDGPLFVSQGGTGVVAKNGAVRFVPVAVSAAGDTELEAISTKDGTLQNTLDLVGTWGVPYTAAGSEGLSHDGNTLILASAGAGFVSPTNFLVVDPWSMKFIHGITLNGMFSYDALSPDGSRLYLIQYTQGRYGDTEHYIVRAYDLRADKLLPGRIADRTQKSWVMQGTAVTRTTSSDGRWVYTLYMNPTGYPFIHALDTVRGVAHCVGLPWTSTDQNALYNVVLSLHGRTLAVHWRSGRPWLDVDTATWRVSPAHGGLPLLWIGFGGGAAAASALALLLLRRRRRSAEELEQELADLLRLPEREVVV